MEISFVKVSPTQNVTILVTSAVVREAQGAVAARLLAWDSVCGEQVGFLEAPSLPGTRARLQMMGGEFCGNATMSLGAYLARQEGMADGNCAEYRIEVSGADAPVACRIARVGGAYRGTVWMPLPESIGTAALETDAGAVELPLVELPGISHVVAPVSLGRAEIERRIRGWNGVIGAEALGVLRFDEDAQTIEPIVYVPSTDSAVWERGCGSGTAALGCWLAHRESRPYRAPIRQPGGEIDVSVSVQNGRISGVEITGTVRITALGTAFV